MNKFHLLLLVIVSSYFAIGVYSYPLLPESMASHWNLKGQVDGYMHKFWGVFLLPFTAVGLSLLFIVIPRIDPLKSNIERFRKYYAGYVLLFQAFLFYLYILIILWNFGVNFHLIQLLTPAIGVVFYSIGVLLGKVKRNWFIGIRTPWTLSNDVVWDKTHKLGGKLFKIAGLIPFLGILMENLAVFLILIPILIVSIYLIVYSYVEYKKIEK
jgi:uncharacterized membrane protein